MIVLWYDRKQEQILLEAKEQIGQPQFFFMEQLGRVSSGISAVNRRFTLVKLTEI